jgi:hypothetical protein
MSLNLRCNFYLFDNVKQIILYKIIDIYEKIKTEQNQLVILFPPIERKFYGTEPW